MRIDLSDLDRLTGIAEALERLFWCLLVVAFFAAVLGSHGTGLLLLILGAAAFVIRAGLEDFVRAHREPMKPAAEPEFTVHRAQRRPRRTKSAV
jgi:hypothetical protein